MARKPPKRNWSYDDPAAPLVSGVAPAATVALLSAADAYPVAVATMPYACCAHSFDSLSEAGRFERYWAQVIAPGASHGRMAVSVAVDQSSPGLAGTSFDHQAWTDTGGTTGANVVLITEVGNFGFNIGAYRYEDTGITQILMSDPGINDTPAAATGRKFELSAQLTPYVEDCYIRYAAGVSLCITDRPDLSTL